MERQMAAAIQAVREGRIPFQEQEGAQYAVVRFPDGRRLVAVSGKRNPGEGMEGAVAEADGSRVFCGPLSANNAYELMRRFPYAAPRPHRGVPFTLGLGDRLGTASRGHIRAVRGRGVFPVLAQQSMRELALTGRTYEEVLAAAAFAVFEERFEDGYGADGDHLKTPDEIRYALGCGYTMITLDCSEHIDNTVAGQAETDILARYDALPADLRARYEDKYLGRPVPSVPGAPVSRETLARIVLIYHDAVDYTIRIYRECIASAGRPIDFEMSIDETATPTDPAAHYVVARELLEAGVEVTSLAPRFCGEFQKGIDYIGDAGRFAEEFEQHARIADRLGYKISVHSGSDKFTVFPAVGRCTGGRVHVKTAGTSWLEAVRLVAERDPALYRELHAFALDHIDEAKKYYHIGTSVSTIPALASTPDPELAGYLDRDDSRQALHITYGLILQERDEAGGFRFRDRLNACLHEGDDAYARMLERHILRHLAALGR
ncbi:MAG: hypothetical protein KBA30_01145 [Clostridia bacterium]|nr:hypothetical protein [Clostridia bacterium]